MTPALQLEIEKIAKEINPGNVLEVGSLDVNGSVRQYFDHAYSYVGIDLEEGNGVDMVMNAHKLTFADGEFDTVLCLEMLEHDAEFWLTIGELYRVLKKGGTLIISTPGIGFFYHPYPKDYYRFTEDVYSDVFFAQCDMLDIKEIFDTANQKGIVAYGKKR